MIRTWLWILFVSPFLIIQQWCVVNRELGRAISEENAR